VSSYESLLRVYFIYTVFTVQPYQTFQHAVPRGGSFVGSGVALSQEVPTVK
jgi:hypothetical protein